MLVRTDAMPYLVMLFIFSMIALVAMCTAM
jgi:hypothetical protein